MSYNNEFTGFEIAVIGMAGRFPGAKNIDELWENICNGVNSISFMSDEELLAAGVHPELLKNPNYIRAKGVLKGKEDFDFSFFKYTPDEAKVMDPQVRLFHECVWEGLESAGYNLELYKGLIGIYGGAAENTYWLAKSRMSGSKNVDPFSVRLLSMKDFLSTRVSYNLNLKGPSTTIFNACSTSLIAVHLACRALISGECNIAVAGGVSLQLPDQGYLYEEGMVFSKDGHVRVFDEKATGTVFGEGAAVVVLKPMEDALRDRDNILAIIKSSSINNDGNRKVGFTAPSVKGQVEVIQSALEIAQVKPEEIIYVETHGTGTALGDPIEVEALRQAYSTNKKGYCAIGSIKPNIGHLDTAAGVTGLIKTVLVLKNKKIPPCINYETPNSKIDFNQTPFFVNTQLKEWQKNGHSMKAAVSSFGIGGTNAHVILEEAPVREEVSSSRDWQLVLLSAKSKSALKSMSDNLFNFLSNNKDVNLADVSYTLQTGRKNFPYKQMLVCKNLEETFQVLSLENSERVVKHHNNIENPLTVFMFSGQGSQYVNMGLELYQKEGLFKKCIDDCFTILTPIIGVDLKKVLFADGNFEEAKTKVNDVEYSGPVKFIFEYSLAKFIMDLGIRPNALIGHSFGEYTAACLAGVFSLKDALFLVTLRGKLMKKTSDGAMTSVPLSKSELVPYLNAQLSLAAVNTDNLCLVSGPINEIENFEQTLEKNGLEFTRINFPKASHSHLMEEIQDEFYSALTKVELHEPEIPYISGLSGEWIKPSEATSPKYWIDHLRGTINFNDGISKLLKENYNIFIQIGSDKGLPLFVSQNENIPSNYLAINLIKHHKDEVSGLKYFIEKLGVLWLNGIAPNWDKFYYDENRFKIWLPTYPFEKKRCWIEGNPFARILRADSQIIRKNDIADWFYIPTWAISPLPPVMNELESINWLIFNDNNNIGNQVSEKLNLRNHKVTIIQSGEKFEKINNSSYKISPSSISDYESLIHDLSQNNNLPDKIIHLWSLNINEENKDFQTFEKVQELGLYSLVSLAKTLGQSAAQNLQIYIITNNTHKVVGNDIFNPEKATILSALKVLPQEFSNIACINIDIELDSSKSSSDIILAETNYKTNGQIIAYRAGYRWCQTYKEQKLDQVFEQNKILKNGGVYLVTGGLGRVGLVISMYLAKEFKAKLVLVSRTEYPDKEHWNEYLASEDPKKTSLRNKINLLKEIEKAGGEVLVISADVSDKEMMIKVVENAEKQFGHINGIIHAAGVLDAEAYKPVQEISEDVFESQFRPKVQALFVLEELFKDKEIDFLLSTSSIASVLGGLGFIAYSAGNIFLDAYTHYHNSQGKTKWLSINWDGWIGLDELDTVSARGTSLEGLSMRPDEGGKAFHRALAWLQEGQLVNSTGDLQQRINKWVNLEQIKNENQNVSSDEESDESNLNARPDISSEYIEPRNDIDKEISKIWGTLFGIGKLGIDDNFFELGGDSLKGMLVVANIHKKLNKKVPIKEFFRLPTIRAISDFISSSDIQKDSYQNIQPTQAKPHYKLSSAQMRLYILQRLEKYSLGYNETQIALIEGKIERDKLRESFLKLIQRHEILRTSIEIINDEPVQKILNEIDFNLEFEQIKEEELIKSINDFIKPFNLHQPPLFRVKLFGINDAKCILCVDTHHIITDGTSMQLFVRELMAIYAGNQLPELKLQYKDYAEWQNSKEQKSKISQQEKYWLKKFEGEIPSLNLPLDFSRPITQSFEGDIFYFKLNADVVNKVRNLVKQEEVTLYMFLLATVNILFSKLCGQDDIVIGTPIAGRNHHDLQSIMGNFINTLVLRNNPSPEKTITEFLNEVKQCTLEAYENQDYEYENLVEKVVKRRDMSRNPLFDIMFNLHNYNIGSVGVPVIEIDDISIKPYPHELKTTKFDLLIQTSEHADEIHFLFNYSTRLFNKATIERIAQLYAHVINSIVDNIDQHIADVNLLSPELKQKLLIEFNNTKAEYDSEITIHELFERQVEKFPDNIALLFGDKKLTYHELNEKSNQLARTLKNIGIGANDVVGIVFERSFEMMISIFAILKSGGAYLPILPGYPEERVKYMLKNSGAKVLLVQSSKFNRGYNDVCKVIDASDSNLYTGDNSNIAKEKDASRNLAYIIYTSGSTGNPKGVMIEHHSVINRMNWMQKNYPLTQEDIILQKTPIVFDVSVWELFWWSFQGAQLTLLVPDGEKSPDTITNTIESNKITTLHFVPSMLSMFLDSLGTTDKVNKLSTLKHVFASGEELKPNHVNKFNDLLFKTNNTKLINLYGPTEATVDVTYFNCFSNHEVTNIPIGKPIDNTKMYIIDKNINLVPIGVAGELCISGVGLARGYINNEELTNEKFIDNPFEPGAKLYKTGDLARWLPDGNIEYLGRIDFQVKIRGFRIELGEIENQLLKHNEIKEAVVIVKDKGDDKYLCAFIVSSTELSAAGLKDHLSQSLPDYMVPTQFVKIDSIPLNQNGKVDRKELLKFEGITLQSQQTYVAPETDLEQIISEAWREVLNVEKVGIDDNFFELGGTSFDIIKLSEKFKIHFNDNDLVMTMFRFPTIRSFASYFNQLQKEEKDSDNTSGITPQHNINRKKQIEMRRKLRENE